jgi:hypothetical protein
MVLSSPSPWFSLFSVAAAGSEAAQQAHSYAAAHTFFWLQHSRHILLAAAHLLLQGLRQQSSHLFSHAAEDEAAKRTNAVAAAVGHVLSQLFLSRITMWVGDQGASCIVLMGRTLQVKPVLKHSACESTLLATSVLGLKSNTSSG